MEINAKKALEILEPIPSENFCAYMFSNDKNQCCAIGHINEDMSGNAYFDSEGFGIRQLSKSFIRKTLKYERDIADVNNSPNIGHYNEPIIKDRVIHLLKDMVAANY